jgi:hypothetical protein
MSASSGNGTKMDRGRPQNRSDASFSWEADAKSWRLLLLIPGSYLQRLSMRLLGVFSPNISKHTHMTVLGALRSSFIIRHDRGTSAWKHKQCKRNEAGAQEGHYSDGLVPAIKRCSIYLLPLFAVVVIASLNIHGHFIGEKYAASRGEVEQKFYGLVLQLTAKLIVGA